MGTTKKRFIELHGEEAWEIESQKRNKKAQEYRDSHKDELKNYFKKHYKEHRLDKIDYAKNYYSDNKDLCLERFKLYSNNHRQEINTYKKDLRKTKLGRASNMVWQYKYDDKISGRGECDLTSDWVMKNIFDSSCIYCGDSDWTHLGCDRIDNSLPHTKDNCVCSCGLCNMERADRFTVSEFVEYRKTHPRVFHEENKMHVLKKINGVSVLKKCEF